MKSVNMSELVKLAEDLCNTMEKLNPDWEDCPTCRPVIPFLRANKNSMSITPIKIRVRSLMRELRFLSPLKYKEFNIRFRDLKV